jgi:MFS family permease
VGLGEAGCNPPAHSIIADYFPQEKRAIAYAIFALGIYFGILFGFSLGGLLDEYFGWRMAFFIIGLPGILFALLFRWTVKEPKRVLSVNESVHDMPSFIEVWKFLVSRKTFICLSFAVILHSFVGNSFANWMPPFLSRVHGMGTVEIGIWLAVAIGIFGAIGTFLGGYIGDKWSKKDRRWYLWLGAISIVLSLPFGVATLLANNKMVAIFSYFLPNVLYAIFLGPSFAVVQGIVGSRMRALSSAVIMILISFFGMGLGPYVTGILSDYLQPEFGVFSIRWSLLSICIIDLIAACFFYAASTSLEKDWIA